MRAVVFLGDRELELREFEDPTPGPGEVVLEIKASGMCGSDLKFYRAPRDGSGGASALGLGGDGGPVIAGHEPCGVVAAVGEGVTEAQARIGQRVMNHHYAGCGVCNHCRVGWSQLCAAGFVVYGVTGNGGHAPYMKAPARTMVPLPEQLSFETGAAVSCGTGTAFGALRRLGLSGRDTIAIHGQGPVGLSATQLAKAMGARVIALDVGAERRALARDFGADTVIDPSQDDPVEAVRELTHGAGTDLALDCSGAPEARVAAVRGTRTWGTVAFVGEGDTVTLDVSQDLIRKQITIIASWTFSSVGQSECAQFVADRGIAVDHLFTHRYSLDQAEEAYKLFDTQTTGKGVFLP
ncbi:MAG: zinc-binding dehydrogenase [SAR324 cluster bacterium]|nr:zinc-binding dehydrogenase [SAR324 cluster bacterium]MCZ6558719.1 zinc-binding dehydrogenase [SAR324 cluster bacterium]MCZ6646391.1 zinc-binding dehydrogenase [SAR324 cluster bacterium]MCZ6841342.1 zinc-binding dehydrogenase [SAR324 cluster bacterium]